MCLGFRTVPLTALSVALGATLVEYDCAAGQRGRIGRQRFENIGTAGGERDLRDQAVGRAPDRIGWRELLEQLRDAGEGALRAGTGGAGQSGHIELRLLNEELGFVDFLGLRDLATGRHDPEGVLLGSQRRRRDHPSRGGQRVSRLPCECLRKAGGEQQRCRQEPHGHKVE